MVKVACCASSCLATHAEKMVRAFVNHVDSYTGKALSKVLTSGSASISRLQILRVVCVQVLSQSVVGGSVGEAGDDAPVQGGGGGGGADAERYMYVCVCVVVECIYLIAAWVQVRGGGHSERCHVH